MFLYSTNSNTLLWMPLLCLNMFLLYLLISSIHYSIMISPPTKKTNFLLNPIMNNLIYIKSAYFMTSALYSHKI